MQGAKEQALKGLKRVGETKARLETDTFGFHNLAVGISHMTQLCGVELYCRRSIRYVFLNKYFLIYEMSYGTS